jgi:hypothetical protein
MTRTQIQRRRPYAQAKRVAERHEISLAELVRRGLEHMLRVYRADAIPIPSGACPSRSRSGRVPGTGRFSELASAAGLRRGSRRDPDHTNLLLYSLNRDRSGARPRHAPSWKPARAGATSRSPSWAGRAVRAARNPAGRQPPEVGEAASCARPSGVTPLALVDTATVMDRVWRRYRDVSAGGVTSSCAPRPHPARERRSEPRHATRATSTASGSSAFFDPLAATAR